MGRVPFHQQLMFALQMLMGLAYMGGGTFLVASSQTFGVLPTGGFRMAMAVMLLVYGAFRLYRGLKAWKS